MYRADLQAQLQRRLEVLVFLTIGLLIVLAGRPEYERTRLRQLAYSKPGGPKDVQRVLQPSSPLAGPGEAWSLSEVLPAQFLNASRQGWQFGALGGHALRVAAFSYAIAQSYGLHPRVCERLRRVATFHDIGKIFLSEALLNKPGPLTPSERRDIENHTVLGYELLLSSSLPTLREAAIIAFCHHERMDGLGYPRKRLGHEIPLGARIVSVADVFDALTSTRSYRPAMSEAQAAEIIRQGGGSQFDREVVSAFSSVLERYPGWASASAGSPRTGLSRARPCSRTRWT